MPSLEFAIDLPAPLERVWAWHEDIATALKLLAPPADDARIESIDLPPRVGTKVIITAKGPLGRRIRWVAEYTEHVPPHPVLLGAEAHFTDIQLEGPFAAWTHTHDMEALGDATTRLVDRITYRPPLWPLSWPGDVAYIRPKIRAMFAHRHAVMRQVFGG